MLSETDYRTYVTGYPTGVVYAVENPDTGDQFDFAGIADGELVYTVASLYDAVQPDGSLLTETAELYLGLAALQMKAAAGTTVLWACQFQSDADALARLLSEYDEALRAAAPLAAIDVRAVPVVEDVNQ
ncbi:hypothetical protein [Cumulibacter soli]|uniref:hypothetical protein n=1 Tax=Cumulibacter soli TaxID=2546344 RepID=UPI0010677EE1|nr:hypothetical protein [Cumulibacter soli]